MKAISIILPIVAISYILLALWARKNWRKSMRSELNSRTRYQVTEELDEQLKRRRK